MAEAKAFEYIIAFEPVALMNGKNEVCFQSRSVSKLVRCADCSHWGKDHCCVMLGYWETPPTGYCYYGEERTT